MVEFGLKYWAEMRSKHHTVLWRVEVSERGYLGSAEEMTFAGEDPILITWEARGDEFYAPVKASEATINILCKENFHYLSLFTSDPRQFRVSIFRSGALYWRGFVTADLYSESFTAPPYTVTIKAVDGFNLLDSYTFKDLLSIGTSGRLSLWDLTTRCLDLLELDMEVSDWLDLYGEGMNEGLSPLRQTYIDLAQMYAVYEEPTYRDILELCLLPFAGQIFQSSGALHIRRAISLYQNSRPVTFFDIGSEFPVGEIMTDEEGTNLIAEQGVNVVTSSGRDVVDDMWAGGVYVMGDATLDIVPALRSITVDVKNKSVENIAPHLGFFSPEAWDDPHSFIDFSEAGDSLCFCGNDAHNGTTIYTQGVEVAQCNFPIEWDFMLQTFYREWSSAAFRPSTENYSVSVHYGICLVAAGNTYYLTDSGAWSQTETSLVSEVKTGVPESVKVEINGFPADGVLQFFIRQTLKGKIVYYDDSGRRSSGYQENATFSQMTMSIGAGDTYDKGLKYESLVNPANNVEMSIELPVSDIPAIPNDHLLYTLYFLDAQGNPTRLWHTKGANNYDTLVGHIVQSALRYKQLPSKRLTGDIFTSAHLDMNTVVKDEKYLHAAYSVNSIELKALDDTYNCELTEMPRFITTEQPADGDDCVRVLSFDFEIQRIIRCLDYLLIHTTDGHILLFDSISRSLREIYYSDNAFEIFAAENGFVRVEGNTFYYCDHRGTIMQIYHKENLDNYYGWATYYDGYFVLLLEGATIDRTDGSAIGYYAYLSRPEAPIQREESSYRRGVGYSSLHGTPQGRAMYLSGNCVVVNTSEETGFSDSRFHAFAIVTFFEHNIISISDNYIIANGEGSSWLYKRTSMTESELIGEIGPLAYCCDHSLSEVAICNTSPYLFDIRAQELKSISNNEGAGEIILGVFFIYGDLYIVRETAIYKYIPPN